MKRHACSHSHGLSLVELLVALSLAAMMLAPLAALMRNMAAASATAADRTALARDADFALSRIAAAVRATPATLLAAPANGGTDDSGNWFNVEFKWENGQLMQKNPDGVLADNVTNFAITAPYVETGQQLVQVSLTLARNDVAITSGLTLRLGGMR
jgi:Tfp pilus assembly protein FimT